jgi:ubiquinone/menaquinone biosynthesis C-methylase UbiE
MEQEGLFDYLKEPRTYGEILARFGYVDSDYTRDLLTVLAEGKPTALILEDGHYRVKPDHELPKLEEVIDRTDQRYQGFVNMGADMLDNIPRRLRGQPVEFTNSFAALQGRGMISSFDKLLSIRFYTISRKAAFALLTRRDRAWLRGKSLLEVGCGTGRETAELWLRLDGDIRITAIDPVPSMLARAEQDFPTFLKDMQPDHPPVTPANRPVFQEASGMQLPFEDHSFDAAFYAYILHWTADPRQVVSEIVRVVKPEGLIFGVQVAKPYWSPYSDLIMRSNENSHGFFWREEHRQWYAENGFNCEITAPSGVFRARKSTP